jgi:hypothetical protein
MGQTPEYSAEVEIKPRLRNPPAYQEYASDVMSNINWRMMSFAERGLLDTLRKECWVNGKIPSDPDNLAKLLNVSIDQIASAFSSLVRSFFEFDEGFMVCPELEKYRAYLQERHRRMAEGGRRGGERTQRLSQAAKHLAFEEPFEHGTPQATFEGTLEARVKPLRGEESTRGRRSRGETIHLTEEHKQWVQDYDNKA